MTKYVLTRDVDAMTADDILTLYNKTPSRLPEWFQGALNTGTARIGDGGKSIQLVSDCSSDVTHAATGDTWVVHGEHNGDQLTVQPDVIFRRLYRPARYDGLTAIIPDQRDPTKLDLHYRLLRESADTEITDEGISNALFVLDVKRDHISRMAMLTYLEHARKEGLTDIVRCLEILLGNNGGEA